LFLEFNLRRLRSLYLSFEFVELVLNVIFHTKPP
jgi:hypothetical protein